MHGCRQRKTLHRERFAKEMTKGKTKYKKNIGISVTAHFLFSTYLLL
jgi:hypothetical protein